ncbi:MAG TPA: hypothetical protein V6D47_17860 [Oscillatoriaceae cyanobacterium]
MYEFVRIVRANADREAQGGGGGPTAHREVLNQDGSRLDALGGPVLNPTGENPVELEACQFERLPDLPVIGGEAAITEDEGQTRAEVFNLGSLSNPTETLSSGWPQGDPSNFGIPNEASQGFEVIEPESEE